METDHLHEFFLYQVNNADQHKDGYNGGIYPMFRALKQERFSNKSMGCTNELHGIDNESPGIDGKAYCIIYQCNSYKK